MNREMQKFINGEIKKLNKCRNREKVKSKKREIKKIQKYKNTKIEKCEV